MLQCSLLTGLPGQQLFTSINHQVLSWCPAVHCYS